MPARSLGSRSRRLRDPRDLEGIITSQIVHWRAFFILFYHFRCLKLFVLLKVSRNISLTYAAVRQPCDGRATAGRVTASMRLSIIPGHGAHLKIWNFQGKSTKMDGDEDCLGSMLMDISDGDLFNIFREEWATEVLMEPKNDGRVGHPPAQPEQPTTARFPAPARRVAIQHCRRLSVYPFLPEWPGQAAANSDRLYGRASSRDMVSREKKREKKGGGGCLMYAFVCPLGMNCHFQAFLAISQRNETF